MSFEKVSVVNGEGHRLAGRLDLPPDGKPLAYALFAHCFTCTKNLKAAGHISRALTQQGIAVLRFDFTGLGESEGDFADTNFSSNVDDLVEVAGWLAREREAPRVLVGHSLGGAAVIRAAPRIDSVRAVATIGAPHDPRHVAHLFGDSLATIEQTGEARVTLAGRPFTVRRQLLDDLAASSLDEALAAPGRALLLFHSPVDQVVGVDNAARLFQAARHPKSFVSLDRADHLLSDEADSLYVGSVLGAWARKYVGAPREERPAPLDAGDSVVASLETAEAFRTEIVASGHALLADEPRAVGGTNAGPSPYELLAAALGACTAMTLRLYAERKAWPLESTVVRLNHHKQHATDCAGCEGADAAIDVIEREIELAGPLDAAQRQRLLEIADRCPVHRTLTGGALRVTTRLASPSAESSS
jgi:putative redox protein